MVSFNADRPASPSRPATAVSPAQTAVTAEQYYVTAEVLNVREAPNAQSQRVDRVKRWDTLNVLEISNGWAKIDRGPENPAYVSDNYLKQGSGQQAEAQHCRTNAGALPRNAEILTRSLGRGFHEFTVKGGPSATVVKMKDMAENDVLSFYVAPHSSVLINTIPDGKYAVYFASGETWSKSCGRFLSRMNVTRDPNPVVLTGNSNGMYTTFGYELTQQTGGNFRPSIVRDEDF